MRWQNHALRTGVRVLLLTLLIGAGVRLSAQDQPPDAASALALEYGLSASGRLDDRTPQIAYTFSGLRGDLIALDLRVTTGDLAPMLTLVDSGGGVVALADSAGGGVQMPSLRLPASDRYFLIAGRFGGVLGLTSGDFTLALTRRGPSSASGSTLRYGDAVINAITAAEPQVYYTFQAAVGDVITARMQRMSGDLDPKLLLVNSAGVIVAQNDDQADPANPGSLDAALPGLVIQEAGIYVIIATRFGQAAGTSSGNFVLTLTAGEAAGGGRTALTPLPIAPGAIALGTITPEQVEVWYALDGQAGQTLTIAATRTGGDLDTLIQVLDSTQAVIGENDDTEDAAGNRSQNSRLSVTLPTAGRYLILVTRYQRAAGTTTGSFSLRVE